MKGLTSIELAILLAIILVIAVAVGWYVYTTFLAATTGTPRLNVINAIYWTNGTLNLTVQNPGPVETVYIQSVYLQGRLCNIEQGTGQGSEQKNVAIKQADGPTTIKVRCEGNLADPGTSISGQVVLTTGQVFPFTAQVRQGQTTGQQGS